MKEKKEKKKRKWLTLSVSPEGKRKIRILFAIYLAIYLLILVASGLQAAGVLEGGVPAWYVWPLGVLGAGITLYGSIRGGNWLLFSAGHAVLVITAFIALVDSRMGDPDFELVQAALPAVIFLLAPLLLAMKASEESRSVPKGPTL